MTFPQAFIDTIEQEIDFIGQIYVEWEQLATYDDILISPENLRSLASLFHDFADRLFRVVRLKNELLEPGSTAGVVIIADSPAEIPGSWESVFRDETIRLLQPFLDFYRQYKNIYPDKIIREQVDALFHAFPDASEKSAADLRNLLKSQRKPDAQ
jgi:hypothetical protein